LNLKENFLKSRLIALLSGALVLMLSAGLSLCLSGTARAGAAEREALEIVQAELVKVQAKKTTLQELPRTEANVADLHRLDADVASLTREIAVWNQKLGKKPLFNSASEKTRVVAHSPDRVSHNSVNRSGGRISRVAYVEPTVQGRVVQQSSFDGAAPMNLVLSRDLTLKTAGIWEDKP
jgi:hypothetical protein